jgi:peptidoglycan/xylan/chitin deacetylase (PgdA/CDA1 family)
MPRYMRLLQVGAVLMIVGVVGVVWALQERDTRSQTYLPLDPGADFSRGWTGDPTVSLTFDADHHSSDTNDHAVDGHTASSIEILDVLKDRKLTVTFFLTGRFIEANPALVRRIVRDGHEVGNHTYSHPQLTTAGLGGRQTLAGVTRTLLKEELQRTAVVYEQVTGTEMVPLWRAPSGEHNAEIRQWAAELGYLHVGWTQNEETGEMLDTLDWVTDTTSWYFSSLPIKTRPINFGDATPEKLNGGIVLFHLGSDRLEDPVFETLPVIIDDLRAHGYSLVPVTEMLRTRFLVPDGLRIANVLR